MAKIKKSLKDLNQTNGRDEAKTPKFEPTTLEQLFGEKDGSERYSTMDTEEYERYLNEELNPAEIRRHAVEVAHIRPSTNLERTKKQLIIEHRKHVTAFTQEMPKAKKDPKPDKELLKIMAEVK